MESAQIYIWIPWDIPDVLRYHPLETEFVCGSPKFELEASSLAVLEGFTCAFSTELTDK